MSELCKRSAWLVLVGTLLILPVTGFAQPVVDSSPEVYRFTPTTPLAPGVYFITALAGR